jgi:hypothetical protein
MARERTTVVSVVLMAVLEGGSGKAEETTMYSPSTGLAQHLRREVHISTVVSISLIT